MSNCLVSLSPEMKASQAVKHALALRSAWVLCNYHYFFQLYLTAPNMSGYLIDLFADRVRKQALKIMFKSWVESSFFFLQIMSSYGRHFANSFCHTHVTANCHLLSKGQRTNWNLPWIRYQVRLAIPQKYSSKALKLFIRGLFRMISKFGLNYILLEWALSQLSFYVLPYNAVCDGRLVLSLWWQYTASFIRLFCLQKSPLLNMIFKFCFSRVHSRCYAIVTGYAILFSHTSSLVWRHFVKLWNFPCEPDTELIDS